MTQDTTYIRAVLLATLTITSAVAGVAVLGGAVVAQENSTLVVDADGEKGNYTTIDGALTAASAGDTIEVHDGTYDEQVVVDAVDVTLEAVNDSGATVRFDPGSSSTGQPAVAVTANGATVSGFVVERVAADDRDPNATFGTWFTQGIRISASDVVVENNDVAGEGFADGVNNKGIMVLDDESGGSGETVTNVSISDNDVSGFAGPLAFAAYYGGTVSDVSFSGNTLAGTIADGISVGEQDGTVDVTLAGYDYEATSDQYPGTTVHFEGKSDALEFGADAPGAVVTDADGDYVVGPWMSIQDAVNASEDGDTINVESGTFTEQVVIDANVTLVGAGEGQTTIESPSSLARNFTYPNHADQPEDAHPVVFVDGADAEVSSLTVDGAGQGDDNRFFFGIMYANASGTVDDVTVTGVRESPLSGNQHGVAVGAFSLDGADREVTLRDSTLADYQKNGFVARGDGLTAHVVGNDVTGAGPTDVIGQNGIQIGGDAVGVIENNTVSGHVITRNPDVHQPANIILYGHGDSETVVRNNTVYEGVVGLAVAGPGNLDVADNEFTNNSWHVFDYNATPTFVPTLDASAIYADNEFPEGAAYVEDDAGTPGHSVYGSLQTAIDGGAGDAGVVDGDTVTVTAGTYDEAVTVDTANVTLAGPNAGTPGDGSRGDEAVVEGQVVVNASGVVFDGFTVSPPPATSNAEGEALRVSEGPDDVVVRNNVVRDFGEDGIPEWEGIDGIVAFGGDGGDAIENVTIADNEVRNVQGRTTKGGVAAISVQGNVDGADVTDNVVTEVGMNDTAWAFGLVVRGTGNTEEDPKNVTLVGNDVSSVYSTPASDTVGVGMGVEADASAVTAYHNSIQAVELLVENKDTANALNVTHNWWGDANGPNATGNPWNTSAAGIGGDGDTGFTPWLDAPADDGGQPTGPVENVDQGDFFASIQAAVDAADAGDTIEVGPGTYDERVQVGTDGVTLAGSGGPDATVANQSVVNSSDGPVVQVNAANVTVSGFTVTGADGKREAGQGVDVNGDVYDTDDVRLIDLVVEGNDDRGLVVDYTDNATVENVVVRDNFDPENDGDTPEDGWETTGDADGITLWYTNESRVVDVRAINNSDNGVYANGNDNYFENVTAKNNGDEGLDVSSERVAGGAEIVDLTAVGNNAEALEIEGNDAGTTVSIDGATLADSPRGLYVRGNNAGAVTVESATFENNAVQVLDEADSVDVQSVFADATFDRAVVADSGDGIYSTIQDGFDAAAVGDTVKVAPGTYGGSINVTGATDVTVQGVGDGEAVFEPTEMVSWSVGGYGTDRSAAVRVVDSEFVRFDGLTFDFGQVKDPAKQFTGILYWNSTGELTNNTIENTSTTGGIDRELTTYFRAPGYTNESRAYVGVENNTFENTGRNAVGTHDYVHAHIRNNTFHSADDDAGYAIELGSESVGEIIDNEIHGYVDAFQDGSQSAGVYVEHAFTTDVPSPMKKQVLVAENEIYDNQNGIQFGQTWDGLNGPVSMDVTFVNNHVHDNTVSGVNVVDEDAEQGSSVRVQANGNTIENNGEVGYHVFTENDSSSAGDGDVNVSIFGDAITGHETGIKVQDGGDAADSTIDVTVSTADLSGNDVGVNNTWVEAVDATFNYWGAGDGPSGAAPGSGAAVSENVTYRPWLESAGGPADSDPVTFHVDPASGDDANNGSETAPFETIDAAMDAAMPGDTVHLENGTYDRASTLDIAQNGTTIVGESREGVVLNLSDVPGYGIRTPVDGDVRGVHFENLTVVGPQQDANSNYAFKLNPTTDGVTIRNVSVTDSHRTSIDFNGVGNVTIRDVTVSNTSAGNGISLADTRNVFVQNVVLENNTWGGIALYTNDDAPTQGTHEVDVVDSAFLNNSGPGVYAQNSNGIQEPFVNVSLFNNRFADNPVQVAELQPNNDLKTSVDWFDLDTVVEANDFDRASTVRTYDGFNVTVPAVFSTVQDGVDAASSGEIVHVDPGTYDESVTVTEDDVHLLGSGDETVLTGRIGFGSSYADGVWISEFNFTGEVDGAIQANGAGDDLLVQRSTFDGPSAAIVTGGTNVGQARLQDGWRVAHNRINGTGVTHDRAALQLRQVTNVSVYNNTITNANFSAVSLWQTPNATVTDNTIDDSQRAGVFVADPLAHENATETFVAVAFNTFVNAGDDDGQYTQAAVLVDGLVENRSGVHVHENRIVEHRTHGVYVLDADGVDATGEVDATGNYWGAPTGPGLAGPGTGASVSSNVTYAPWYTDAGMTALSSEPPQVSGVTLTDLTDGNGVVGDGDEVKVSATVVDESGVASVTTDSGLFGAGQVTLTHESGDTYTATFTVDAASAAADGSYRLSVAATDVSGNSASATSGNAIALSTDSTTSMTFGVSDATPLNTETVDVTVTVENVGDREAERTITLLVDGSDVATRDVTLDAGETRTLTFEHRFSTGSHDVTVSDGNVTLAPKTVVAERATNPDADVTVTSPASGQAFATDEVTVEYDLTDADEGIAAVAYDLDDGAKTGTLDLKESNVTLKGLSDGQHTVTLTLVDHLGNELADDSVTFGVDNSEPVVTIDPARTDAIGANAPVEVNLTVEEDNPDTAEFRVLDGKSVVYSEDVSDELADGEATVTWDGTDDAGNALATGQYDLVLAATDAVGNANETAVPVDVDNTPPAAGVAGVDPTELGSGETVTVNVTASDASSGGSGVATVDVTLYNGNYRTTGAATFVEADGVWTVTFDAADLDRDGSYAAEITATDGAGNVYTVSSGGALDVDTTAPSVSAVVKLQDRETGQVNVTVDGEYDGSPNVTLTNESGQVPVTGFSQVGSTDVYAGTFDVPLNTDEQYEVEANVTDAAGNLGETTSSTNVSNTLDGTRFTITGGDGTVVVLNMTKDVTDEFAAFTTSDSPLAELGTNLGSTFLNGELSQGLTTNLDNATIRVPTAGNVPPGAEKGDVELRRYDPATGSWEKVEDTRVKTVGGTEYFVVTVDSFSTWGPVSPDTTAPSIDDTRLTQGGPDYDYGTDEVEVTVEYSDNKQVDAGSVTVRFDGTDVTAASATSVSSSAATYTASGLVGSGQHWVNVTVADTADNLETHNVSFTVEQDTTAPSVDLVEDTFAYGTDPVPLEFTYDDALSGVDTSTVEFRVDGKDHTAQAIVTGDGVEYDATGLGPGTYPASLNVSDGDGNWANETVQFTVRGDGDQPTVTDTRFAPTLTDGALPVGTTRATISLDYEDATSGIDAGAISVDFEGQDVTDEAVITPGSLEYTALGLENGTSYTLQAEIVDEEGNSWTETVTFEVAEPAPPASGPTRPSRSSGSSGDRPEPVGVSKFLEGGNASFALDRTISRLDVSFRASLAAGSVSVRSLDEVPDGVEPVPNARTVSLVDVTVPDDLTDDSATLRLHVSADAVGDADPSRLAVYRHADGDWQALETSVVSTTDETVVLEAETPGFSVFAVGVTEAQETTTTTEQPDDTTTTTEQPDDTTTTTEQPDDATTTTTTTDEDGTTAIEEPGGFGSLATVLVVVAVAMVLALYYVRYRRD